MKLDDLLGTCELLPFDVPWKTAEPAHEARLARLLDALDALDELPPSRKVERSALGDAERAHVALLATCNDGLAGVLENESIEELVVYLPAVLRPLSILLSCAPLVGREGGPSPRELARGLLEAAALLGGNVRLGFLNLVGGEDTVPQFYSAVYPRALARFASLVRWAVTELEATSEEGTVPASIVESAPRLAAARFERARRVCWPSLEIRWKQTNGLPVDIRRTREAWDETDKCIAVLTDAIERVETGKPPQADGTRPSPGALVFVPAKGVTVVLEQIYEHDVVAHWARPSRPDTWYPPASLAVLSIAAPPFYGPVPFEVAYPAKRALQDRTFKIRISGGAPSIAAMRRQTLDEPSGLEHHTGRAYVDEDKARTAPDPTEPRVQATQASSALTDYIDDLLVLCDPVLGRVALDRARRLALCAVNAKPRKDDGYYVRTAHSVLATAAWVAGDDNEAASAADRFAAVALERTDDPDVTTLAALASMRRWDAARAVLATASWKKARAKWTSAAKDEWDLGKDAAWARQCLRIITLVERLAADAGLADASAYVIRALLAEEPFEYETLLWLRVLHGGRGWTPREVALSSYFELPARAVRYNRGGERRPPAALVDEVAALALRVT